MKRILFALLVLGLLFISCRMVRGAEERIINLPQDQARWYISVVDDKGTVLSAFDATDSMKKLKAQVHFLPIRTNTAVYRERYAKDQGDFAITALPCVRVQTDKGTVVYQACGKQIPSDPSALYAEIAAGIDKEVSRWVLLPWRRKHNAQPGPQPGPEPIPIPDEQLLAPEPVGPPVLDTPAPEWPMWLCVGLFAVGLVWGEVERAKEFYKVKK